MIKQKTHVGKDELEIYTHNLSKTYGSGEKSVKAVNKINLNIEPGVHGFLGPNGAGKTSTINMLVGAISISNGEARIRGRNVGSVKTRRLIGFLPQDPSFYERMTGEQYLIFMAQLNGIKKKVALKKAEEILKFLDLSDAKDRKIGKYSGGMKQKIGIGAALIHDPELLILDEPTANLDPIGRADLIEKIKKLSERMSVFEIEQMCKKVTMINKGKIIISDTIKNIKEFHTESANIFILNTNSNEKILPLLKEQDCITKSWFNEKEQCIYIVPSDIDKLQMNIPKLIAENNLMLKGFSQQEASLQDIFIDIIEGDENFK